jgi:hypothetical protein
MAAPRFSENFGDPQARQDLVRNYHVVIALSTDECAARSRKIKLKAN